MFRAALGDYVDGDSVQDGVDEAGGRVLPGLRLPRRRGENDGAPVAVRGDRRARPHLATRCR